MKGIRAEFLSPGAWTCGFSVNKDLALRSVQRVAAWFDDLVAGEITHIPDLGHPITMS
jgi:hypothetical protein